MPATGRIATGDPLVRTGGSSTIIPFLLGLGLLALFFVLAWSAPQKNYASQEIRLIDSAPLSLPSAVAIKRTKKAPTIELQVMNRLRQNMR